MEPENLPNMRAKRSFRFQFFRINFVQLFIKALIIFPLLPGPSLACSSIVWENWVSFPGRRLRRKASPDGFRIDLFGKLKRLCRFSSGITSIKRTGFCAFNLPASNWHFPQTDRSESSTVLISFVIELIFSVISISCFHQ